MGFTPPIIAYGKDNLHTLSGENKPTAADTAFTFDNSASTISVDDHVFISNQDSLENQYLGLCTVSTNAGITTEYALETTPTTSGKIWTATTVLRFAYLYAVSGLTRRENDGVNLVETRGGSAFQFQSADPSTTVVIRFDPIDPPDYESLRTIRLARIGSSVSLGFYDDFMEKSRVVETTFGGRHNAGLVSSFLASYTAEFFVLDDDKFVAS